jgi:hypothetical protein
VKNNDLVVGTHGRSIWILDDLTPLREWSPEIAAKPAHLFAVPDAHRFRYHRARGGAGTMENPPRGVAVHYYLKERPKGPITLDVLDADGKPVATLSSKADPDAGEAEPFLAAFQPPRTVLTTEPGINRVVWNLCHEAPKAIKGAAARMPPPTTGPMAGPGLYTLRLTVHEPLTTTVAVRPDPRVQVPASDLNEQLRFALGLRDQITHLTQMVNHIRSVRKQLTTRAELWKENPSAQDLFKQSQELLGKLDDLEGKLHNPKAEIPNDLLAQRGGGRLYSQLSTLLWWVLGSDGAPTQGMREVLAEHTKELQGLEAEFQARMGGDLAKINDLAKGADALKVTVPAENPPKP